jgi:hypothetical protein
MIEQGGLAMVGRLGAFRAGSDMVQAQEEGMVDQVVETGMEAKTTMTWTSWMVWQSKALQMSWRRAITD